MRRFARSFLYGVIVGIASVPISVIVSALTPYHR